MLVPGKRNGTGTHVGRTISLLSTTKIMDTFEGHVTVELLARLRSTEGHLHAVIGMVESDASCEEVLHQLNAVCAALRATEFTLVPCQVDTSLQIIAVAHQVDIRLAEVQRLAHLFRLEDTLRR